MPMPNRLSPFGDIAAVNNLSTGLKETYWIVDRIKVPIKHEFTALAATCWIMGSRPPPIQAPFTRSITIGGKQVFCAI